MVSWRGQRGFQVGENTVSERDTVDEHAKAVHARPFFCIYGDGASAEEELGLLAERDLRRFTYLQVNSLTSQLANRSHPLDGRLGVMVRRLVVSLAQSADNLALVVRLQSFRDVGPALKHRSRADFVVED